MKEKDRPLLDKLLAFRNSETLKTHIYEDEDITKIKIDINYAETSCQMQDNVKWVKDQLKQSSEIKPLVHILKRFLQNKKLNCSFEGGISSYSLLLMVVAFSKNSKNANDTLGIYLFKFFEFYGKIFDFTNSVIDLSQSK